MSHQYSKSDSHAVAEEIGCIHREGLVWRLEVRVVGVFLESGGDGERGVPPAGTMEQGYGEYGPVSRENMRRVLTERVGGDDRVEPFPHDYGRVVGSIFSAAFTSEFAVGAVTTT
jgi:hypothetical protein